MTPTPILDRDAVDGLTLAADIEWIFQATSQPATAFS